MEFFALSWGSLSVYRVILASDGSVELFEKVVVLQQALESGWTRGLGSVPECRQPVLYFDPAVLSALFGVHRHILWGEEPDSYLGFGDFGAANFRDVESEWRTAGPLVALTWEEAPLRDIVLRTSVDGQPQLTDRVHEDIHRLNCDQARRILIEVDALPDESPFFLASSLEGSGVARFRLIEDGLPATSVEAAKV